MPFFDVPSYKSDTTKTRVDDINATIQNAYTREQDRTHWDTTSCSFSIGFYFAFSDVPSCVIWFDYFSACIIKSSPYQGLKFNKQSWTRLETTSCNFPSGSTMPSLTYHLAKSDLTIFCINKSSPCQGFKFRMLTLGSREEPAEKPQFAVSHRVLLCLLWCAIMWNEPWHEISNNVVCATSKGSDQPAQRRSLIRAFASRLNILWLFSYWLHIIWSFKA